MNFTQQSPVDLRHPTLADFGADGLKIKWKKSAAGHIKKDDHGVQVEFDADERQFIVLNRKKFHLVQFHFHHPSEHWVDGQQQTIELHVVHQNVDDGTRAVIGIFIDATKKKSKIPNLFAQIKKFVADPEKSSKGRASTNPLTFLPKDRKHHYRYEGSLTTPEYDENVSWAIFQEPLWLPKHEVVELIKVFRHPARLPQPLNRRFVLATFKP